MIFPWLQSDQLNLVLKWKLFPGVVKTPHPNLVPLWMLLRQLFFLIYVNESTNIALASSLRPYPQGTSSQFKKSVISINYFFVQMSEVKVPEALMQAVRMGIRGWTPGESWLCTVWPFKIFSFPWIGYMEANMIQSHPLFVQVVQWQTSEGAIYNCCCSAQPYYKCCPTAAYCRIQNKIIKCDIFFVYSELQKCKDVLRLGR